MAGYRFRENLEISKIEENLSLFSTHTVYIIQNEYLYKEDVGGMHGHGSKRNDIFLFFTYKRQSTFSFGVIIILYLRRIRKYLFSGWLIAIMAIGSFIENIFGCF